MTPALEETPWPEGRGLNTQPAGSSSISEEFEYVTCSLLLSINTTSLLMLQVKSKGDRRNLGAKNSKEVHLNINKNKYTRELENKYIILVVTARSFTSQKVIHTGHQ